FSAFFFSSRRRHTRFSRDWSSDVCSSDLGNPAQGLLLLPGLGRGFRIKSGGLEQILVPEQGLGGEGDRNAPLGAIEGDGIGDVRSEERRVGKECRARWSQYRGKKKWVEGD